MYQISCFSNGPVILTHRKYTVWRHFVRKKKSISEVIKQQRLQPFSYAKHLKFTRLFRQRRLQKEALGTQYFTSQRVLRSFLNWGESVRKYKPALPAAATDTLLGFSSKHFHGPFEKTSPPSLPMRVVISANRANPQVIQHGDTCPLGTGLKTYIFVLIHWVTAYQKTDFHLPAAWLKLQLVSLRINTFRHFDKYRQLYLCYQGIHTEKDVFSWIKMRYQ